MKDRCLHRETGRPASPRPLVQYEVASRHGLHSISRKTYPVTQTADETNGGS